MTSHELANILLKGPDVSVGLFEYQGDDCPVTEIETIEDFHEDNSFVRESIFNKPWIILKP